jgi:hypothetical protein
MPGTNRLSYGTGRWMFNSNFYKCEAAVVCKGNQVASKLELVNEEVG